MRKATSKRRALSLFMAIAILLSVFSASVTAVFAANTPEISNISISGDTGYYVREGALYKYDVNAGISEAVAEMTGLNARYVLYDKDVLYIAGANTVVTAYNTDDWQQKWSYDNQDAFKFQPPYSTEVFCQPNAEMVLKDGKLYIYAYGTGGTFIVQAKAAVVILDAATGTETAPVGLTSVSNSNGEADSIAYEIYNNIVFTGSTFTTLDTSTGKADVKSPMFNGAAAYESASSMLVGLKNGTLGYTTYPLAASPKVTDMGLKPAGSSPVLAVVDGVAVIFSIKDGKIVYDIFTGLELVTKETQIKAGEILDISISKNDAYVALANGNIEKIHVDFTGVNTHEPQSNEAKVLYERIAGVLSKLPTFNGEPNISRMTLEHEEEINSIDYELNKMSDGDKLGVFNRSWLVKLKDKTDELRKNLDSLNSEIEKLPDAKDLVKNDAAAVKEAKTKYDALSAFDKTLISEKLFELLEKVAAYDVFDMIEALPQVDKLTTENLTEVQSARRAYGQVAEKWRGEVTNIELLIAAEKKIDSLMQDMGEGAYWPSFAKGYTNNAVVDCKLPTSLGDMQIILDGQTQKLSVKEPIIVGERMYTVSGKQLVCYGLDGAKIAAVDLYSNVGFFSRIAYGDNKIFVALRDRIQAFDARTLNSIWLSPATGGQTINTITYNDGYIYTGYTNGDGGAGTATDGAYFCLSTKDENPQDGYEIKEYIWEDTSSGYYWAGGVVVADKIYYAGDDGKVYCHHLTKDIVYDTFDAGGRVRSNLTYDAYTERLFVVTAVNPTMYAIELNEDGTFNDDTVIKSEDGMATGTTGGISCYNGRVYVPSGGMLNSGALLVLEIDEENGKFIKAYGAEHIKTQSAPLICSAYASKENNYKVYVYVIDYTTGIAYAFEDSQGQKEYREAFKISNLETIDGVVHKTTTYNSASFKADQYGNLYFIGGSSWSFPSGGSATTYALTVFKNKNATFGAKDVENAISILTDPVRYEHKEQVLSAKEKYDALSEEERISVSNSEELFSAVDEIERITDEKLLQINEKISQISSPVTLSDEQKINDARRLYGSLTEDDKAKVENFEILREAQDALYELKASVEGLIEKIESLPERDLVTLEHSAEVNELWTAYQALSEGDKQKITNAAKLIEAKDKIKELNDKLLVSNIQREIEELPDADEVTLVEEKKVIDLYSRFGALHKAAQALVENASKLEEVYDNIALYREAVDEIDSLIWNELDPRNITLEDKPMLEKITLKYAELREEERAFVKYYSDVEDALKITASLDKGIIPKQVFENIAGMDVNYSFKDDGHTITFNGMDVTSPSDFRCAVGIDYDLGKEGIFDSGVMLKFEQKGKFPAKAEVSVSLELEDGQYNLYAYNNQKNTAAKLQTVIVIGGKATVSVYEGAAYVISKGIKEKFETEEPQKPNKEANDQPKTGDSSLPYEAFAVLFAISFIAMGEALRRLKKLHR